METLGVQALGVVFGDDVLLVVLVIRLQELGILEDTRTVVLVEVLLHLGDGLEGLEGECVGKGIDHGGTQWVEWVEHAFLLGFLHGHEDLRIRQVVVANEIDLSNLHFVPLVDIDDQVDGVVLGSVGHLLDVDDGIVETFFSIVVLDDAAGLGLKVVGGDVASRKVDLVANLISFRFLDAVE